MNGVSEFLKRYESWIVRLISILGLSAALGSTIISFLGVNR